MKKIITIYLCFFTLYGFASNPVMLKSGSGGGTFKCAILGSNGKPVIGQDELPVYRCGEVESENHQLITVLGTARCVPITKSGKVLHQSYAVSPAECIKSKKPEMVEMTSGDGTPTFTCSIKDDNGNFVQGLEGLPISSCNEELAGDYRYVKFLSLPRCVPVAKSGKVLYLTYAVESSIHCSKQRMPKMIQSENSTLTFTCEVPDRNGKAMFGEEQNLSIFQCNDEISNRLKLVEVAGQSYCVPVTKGGYPLDVAYVKNMDLNACINQVIKDSEAKKIAVTGIRDAINEGIENNGQFDTERVSALVGLSMMETYYAETQYGTRAVMD